MSNKICYIIGACRENCEDFTIPPNEGNLIIAADGGYDFLKKKDITPDILLGDFDSIKDIPSHPDIIKYPQKKDDTDTFLAYKTAFDKGYKNFVVLGGVGGRFDHTIANVQMLLNIAKSGGRAFLIGNHTIMTTVFNGKIEFSAKHKGNVGVFAQGDIAKDVDILGLKYTTNSLALAPDTPIGVSNEFIGESATVKVGNGAVLVVWNEKYSDFISNIEDFTI